MKKDYQFKLIEGEFSPDKARKIIIQMINHKIDFHKIERFSNIERFGGDDDHSKKRVAELERVSQILQETFEWAESQGQKLEVNGTIEIKMIDK